MAKGKLLHDERVALSELDTFSKWLVANPDATVTDVKLYIARRVIEICTDAQPR